ncbi:MAG: DUF3179 domain-containing (seleno)protein, partial [Flavobacteriales bacterium]
QETFRLVGMDHFNAMFEDSRTKSWWRQVNGECVAGPLKGQQLEEVRSEQLTLGEFAERYPKGLVMQPDPTFTEEYEGLAGFDDGTIESSLEYRDTASWQMKSWVVGVLHNGQARAYDWNDFQESHFIIDTLGGDSLLLTHESNGGFQVWDLGSWYVPDEQEMSVSVPRRPDDFSGPPVRWVDSTIAMLARKLPAYQEFWHSWRTFHPNTTRWPYPALSGGEGHKGSE